MADPDRSPVVFSLTSGGQSAPGLLGAWHASPAIAPDMLSFAAGPGTTSPPEILNGPVWRCDLPGDEIQAAQHMDMAEAGLRTIEAALEASTEQLESLIQHQGAPSFAAGESGAVSLPAAFSVPGEAEAADRDRLKLEQYQRLLQVERQTIGLLAYSRRAAAAPGTSFSVAGGWDAESFGLIDDVSARWNEAVRQCQDFLGHLGQAVGHFAWVETRVEGRLQARTCVAWDGDLETGWSVIPDSNQADQHARSLRLALASRILLLRVFSVIGTTAIKLTTLFAVPGGIVLALPTAFNFISQIKNELDRYQNLIV
jgi:hypothetical protein